MDESTANRRESATSLRQLLRQALGLSPEGLGDVPVLGLADDSRQVRSGWLFVAVAGHEADGHAYVSDAIARGAAAVVVERSVETTSGIPVIQVSDTRIAAARLASTFHGLDRLCAEGGLRFVAVTGTNGKSTFCYLVRAVASNSGVACALLGTIEYDLIHRTVPARVTTPGPVELAGYISEAVDAGARMVVLEASSHALHQHRTDGLPIQVGVFTNLSGDHLDYHKTAEEYLAAKKRLFDELDAQATAVLNIDDEASEVVAADCKARRLTYGLNPLADVRARISEITAEGSRFDLITPVGATEVYTALVGRHNVVNCLAAASAWVAVGADPETIRLGLETVERVAGRLERVVHNGADEAPTVLVDYAHTDDALRNVLGALQPVKQKGRLIVVFGCGGDRDRTKRPRMARTAAEGADDIFVTSDNPRSESPERIIQDILAGFDSGDMQRVTIEPDRSRAIEEAIAGAGEDDVVLIAGKGHETYQILGRERVPFDDREIARACLERRGRRE
ncbi:MAG: UDP-N-acetylmuramoyl-L-alanyl-D-glutamate--2,6-diaminopimelate ligase [Phycisphaerae bacterium]|nr:UDP-N-acetylmuramoyl-L-alanyl-D-glutamate--2,6-diaminopimelate ligase [Phycisphaerae bacterium]